MEYRTIESESLSVELFINFRRHQKVTQCMRKINGEWCAVDNPFTDDWTKKDYTTLVSCLKNTIKIGGLVLGAFSDNKLKGFVSVESNLFGRNKEYLDLSCIHVSEDMRGKGIGKELFQLAKIWSKQHGAQKFYISAHSAVETQMFYKTMGCKEAQEYDNKHTENEPCDCQLECVL